jgi:hypothetical protein
VADNLHKWEITGSEILLIGRTFGIGTHIETGPNGNLFVVSLSNGAVYQIYRPLTAAVTPSSSDDIRRTGSYERIPRRSDGHTSTLEPF